MNKYIELLPATPAAIKEQSLFEADVLSAAYAAGI